MRAHGVRLFSELHIQTYSGKNGIRIRYGAKRPNVRMDSCRLLLRPTNGNCMQFFSLSAVTINAIDFRSVARLFNRKFDYTSDILYHLLRLLPTALSSSGFRNECFVIALYEYYTIAIHSDSLLKS